MENYLLFAYSILIVTSFSVICILSYRTYQKLINTRDWVFIGCGVIFTILISMTAITTEEVYGKLKFNIKAPSGLYSTRDSINDPISNKMLYDFLLDMRVKNPKVIYAQAVLESNNFKSNLFNRQNNLFGMKMSERRTKLSTTKEQGLIYEKYSTWEESVTDYVIWSFQNNADGLTEDEYFIYLSKVYAEDVNYISKLKNIINKTDFEKLK